MVKIISPIQSSSISANNYDYIRAFAASRSNDPIIIDELVQAYTLIASNLNISVLEFVETVKNQGNTRDQDLYLAARLNTVRVRNALIGVGGNSTTPLFIARQISA